MTEIANNLNRLFGQYRILLWYDRDQSFTEEIGGLQLEGVHILRVENNEFALKHRLLVQEPRERFLLYAPYERPADEENWLLDLELAYQLFETDREALVLQQLELPYALRPWVARHLEFFQSKERLQRLQALRQGQEDEPQLSSLLLRVVLGGQSADTGELLRSYASAWLRGKEESLNKDLQRFRLWELLWQQVAREYGYTSAQPGIYDFVLELFKKSFSLLAGQARANDNAAVLLARWKDTRSFEGEFRQISERVAQALNIQSQLEQVAVETLLDDDLFEALDQYILPELAGLIEQRSLSSERLEAQLKRREHSHWYPDYRSYYEALRYAELLLRAVETQLANPSPIESFEAGLSAYTQHGYQIDQYYRLFLEQYRLSAQDTALQRLYQQVHKTYSNRWLPELSARWQQLIDREGQWYFGERRQSDFFFREVQSRFVNKGTRVFVLISDALRYECGQELHERFNQEGRFRSTLQFQVTGLPSYTQLGMAALLPHSSLSLDKGDLILIDGKSTAGLQARQKILEANAGVRAKAIQAEDLMKLGSRSPEAKELVQQHDVVYVYHNRIDKVGDDKTSEQKVVEAARQEIDFLIELTRKITSMNVTHVLITADHGFLYQHEPLEESDFTDADIQGDTVKENRRYVIGQNLRHNSNAFCMPARQLQLDNELEILLPKGMNRLRRQGSGSRYIHGGATLQETVVPLLSVAKLREDALEQVAVDVLNKSNNRITTNIHKVKFYQQEPLGPGLVACQLRSYFAREVAGKLEPISDYFLYTFDSDDPRAENREVAHTFTLSSPPRSGQQTVYLMLEEGVKDSESWNLKARHPYTLSIGLDRDF